MTSVAEALPAEQARVRKLKELYLSIGPNGRPAALLMEMSLQRADQAVMSGDVVAMLAAYEDLKGFKE
jgi:hypothetical protein